MTKDELHISLSPPRLSAIRSLSQMVEDFGDAHELPESKIYMINLALDELITNSVTYGLSAKVEVSLEVTDAVLSLTIVDSGPRFDPTELKNPDVLSPLEERAVGGLGVHLVKTFADRVTYEFTGGKNRLTLEHDYTAAPRATRRDDGRGTSMNIEVAEERDGDVLVLLPVGRLDSGNARSFESIVMDFISAGERRLVVDFSRLDFISSSGLRVLLIAAKALKAGKGTIILCSMKNHIEEVFRISGFHRIIPIKPSREGALEASG